MGTRLIESLSVLVKIVDSFVTKGWVTQGIVVRSQLEISADKTKTVASMVMIYTHLGLHETGVLRVISVTQACHSILMSLMNYLAKISLY